MIGQIKDTDHFEIVESDADQPWHARIQCTGNSELTWWTENYVEEESARDAVGSLCSLFSPVGKVSVYETHVEVWLDNEELGMKLRIDIEKVDERTPNGGTPAADAGKAKA